MLKPLIAGNWKMNGLRSDIEGPDNEDPDHLGEIEKLLTMLEGRTDITCDILICPPATLIATMAQYLDGLPIYVGGQDCHIADRGAHTGDVSAPMLGDAGASHIIVGHSERRADHGESDEMVRQKAEAVTRCGLSPIICIGETIEERESGKALDVASRQLMGSIPEMNIDGIAIAYEPVWAIGTGLTPSLEDIEKMHHHIRSLVGTHTRILYGGSVKPGNAAEILSIDHVNGALVGGASLKAKDFFGIIEAAVSL